MGDIGESLTRKLGPLPVWVWAVIAGLGVYLLRNRTSSQQQGGPPSAAATQAEAQLVQAEGAARAATLQSPVTIAPGEQLFDPMTGFLTPQNPDWVGILGTSGAGGDTTGTGNPTPTPTPKPKKKPPPLRGKGAIRAPSGHNRPTAPRGYTDKGLGGGFWEFLPITRTHKGASKGGAKHPPKHTKPGHSKAAKGHGPTAIPNRRPDGSLL